MVTIQGMLCVEMDFVDPVYFSATRLRTEITSVHHNRKKVKANGICLVKINRRRKETFRLISTNNTMSESIYNLIPREQVAPPKEKR